MRLIVNGEPQALDGTWVADLLASLNMAMDRKGLAVALNEVVVPRRLWATTALKDGDRIEIIRAMQGG